MNTKQVIIDYEEYHQLLKDIEELKTLLANHCTNKDSVLFMLGDKEKFFSISTERFVEIVQSNPDWKRYVPKSQE